MENTTVTQEELMLAKILTLIDEYERKQKEFITAFDEFMTEITNEITDK